MQTARYSLHPESSPLAPVANSAQYDTHPGIARRASKLAVALLFPVILTGCGAMAAPCRIASAGIKIVPVVGHVAAAPTDVCAALIDP